MVGLAQMVRASDCGPEGRQFDPDIPPHFGLEFRILAVFDSRSISNSASSRETTNLRNSITEMQ